MTSLANHPIIAFAVFVLDYRFRRIAVVQDGASMGRAIEVGPGEGAWVRYAINADQARFEDAFLAGLNAPVP